MASGTVLLSVLFGLVGSIAAHQPNALCSNGSIIQDRSCSAQISDGSFDSCTVKYFPSNSSQCKEMEFGPIIENRQVGDVILEPYIFTFRDREGVFQMNYTVLNITFMNIKWNTMRFRFERNGSILKNHCRNIDIARNVTVRDQSVLYYDCWWSDQESIYVGENYMLDFRAEGDSGTKRGQYYFTVPSVNQLSPTVKLKDWKPFIYIEIGETSLILHVKPAPPTLGIEKYQIEVVKECHECVGGRDVVQKTVIKTTGEVMYSHTLLHQSGSYYFVVTPIHKDYRTDPDKVCQSVKSPNIIISRHDRPASVICIASITSVVVATLFAYYVILRLVRRYWCKDYKLTLDEESILPPKILVLYSPTNKLHKECVTSFVNYLRYECGLCVMYDADIVNTPHRDPFIWFKDAFNAANYVVYIVGPPEDPNHNVTNIATANCNFEQLQMTFLKECRINKEVFNVLFDHSKGPMPVETLNDRTFYLLRDWQKLIGLLTKNLLPKQQLMRTEKGRCLYEDLKRAKKHFGQKCTFDDVVIKCENVQAGGIDKKTLL